MPNNKLEELKTKVDLIFFGHITIGEKREICELINQAHSQALKEAMEVVEEFQVWANEVEKSAINGDLANHALNNILSALKKLIWLNLINLKSK